jgi:hypothetical protein
MPLLLSGISPQIESVLGQRLLGQGPGLEAYGALEQSLLGDITQRGADARRALMERQAISGTGRSGATAALLGGLERDLESERTRTQAGLGLERAGALNRMIENAIASGLTLEDLMGRRDLSLQQLEEQRRQFDLLNQPPGALEVLGGVTGALGGLGGLAAGLFGRQGAFPLGGNGGGGGMSTTSQNYGNYGLNYLQPVGSNYSSYFPGYGF